MNASPLASPPRAHRRWTGVAVVTAAIMGISIVAGIWQYGRHTERAEALRQYEIAAIMPTAPANSVMAPGQTALDLDATWRRVEATGSFRTEPPTPLRNRPMDSVASYQYLAWFVTTDDVALLVNIGWEPAPNAGGEPLAPELPRGDVTIEAILRDLEPDDGRRGAGATRVSLEQVPPAPAVAFPGYGMLRDSCDRDGPCLSQRGLADVPLPYLSTGPHLSYAWQWWVFAALAPVGAVVLLRRERASAPTARLRQPHTTRKRGLSDEEIEDAL